ncbi:MAG: hypothetical protein KDA21_12575 [Phycisphaerales bacterium]|nr:hypothetical protein [Phycisphaerales bacterium]
MDRSTERRDRLHRLIDLARASRGWSRARLARELHRDPTKLYPESGNPKLDFLVHLAEVLEWPVGEVAAAVWGENAQFTPLTPERNGHADESFEALNNACLDRYDSGDFAGMAEIAQQMYTAARTNDQRALACIREAGGWDGLGRYPRSLDAVRRGLAQGQLSVNTRLILQANLANAQYTLWDLTPALGTTQVLAEWYEANPPGTPRDGMRPAFVYYVRGNTHRRLMAIEEESRERHCHAGLADLGLADSLYTRLADELNIPSLHGIANTCRAGMLELQVESGDIAPGLAVDRLLSSLDAVVDLDADASGDLLESYGWSCIFGSNIALRHLSGRPLQQAMAVFTNKALEIADRLDNWALRERVFTMQYTLHQQIVDATGLDLPYTIDEEDRTLITATMGRFPTFRTVGWQILETARVVEG